MRRRSLAAVVLSLKALGITDVLRFDFIERPPRAALLSALEELLALGALQRDGALSEEGRLMAALPLEPAQAKALVVAARQGGGALRQLVLMGSEGRSMAVVRAAPSVGARAR